jgi:hypothetical protein
MENPIYRLKDLILLPQRIVQSPTSARNPKLVVTSYSHSGDYELSTDQRDGLKLWRIPEVPAIYSIDMIYYSGISLDPDGYQCLLFQGKSERYEV